VSRRSRGRG